MTKLYIFDLEGTTGNYSTGLNGSHINDIIELRPGFQEALLHLKKEKIPMAIATRAPRTFVTTILENLKKRGVSFEGNIYTREEVELTDPQLSPYKNYHRIYKEHNITNPSEQVIVVGDFLCFEKSNGFTSDDYLSFDFTQQPKILSANNSLNDHPLPFKGRVPLYAVVPQLWTTVDKVGKKVSLDMGYVIDSIDRVYKAGEGNFSQGFERLLPLSVQEPRFHRDQFVVNDDLARQLLFQSCAQQYIILKGTPSEWKPLQRLM